MEQTNRNNSTGKIDYDFALRKKRPNAGDLLWLKVSASNDSEAIKKTREIVDTCPGYNLYAGPLEVKPPRKFD